MEDEMREAEGLHKRPSGAVPVLLTLGGVAAAFGVASCCALPMLLAGAGFGTAWLGAIASVSAPHRGLLLGAAALCLGGGGVFLWRHSRRGVCAPGSVCARPSIRLLTLAGLVTGVVLLYLGYTYV
jgi:mercuric ion transport protein